MGLLISRISLESFRSWSKLVVEPAPHVTVLVGPNASGKTNFIEAVQLVTAATSFRRPSWPDVIRWGSDRATVAMSAEGDDRIIDIVFKATGDGKRIYEVQGRPRRRVSDVAGLVPSVLFTPDDLRVVKDAAEARRTAIDDVGDQLSATYRDIRLEYERALRQRNSLLKERDVPAELLDAWSHRLAEIGAALALHRLSLFERMVEPASRAYERLAAGEGLVPRYQTALWDDGSRPSTREEATQALNAELERRRDDELTRRTTLVGPHRDDIVFEIEGKDARSFASQGQQRSIALAWKLAELEVVREISRAEPVLLLDDVMSELDEARRRALAEVVRGSAQTIITTTDLGYFDEDIVEEAMVVRTDAA